MAPLGRATLCALPLSCLLTARAAALRARGAQAPGDPCECQNWRQLYNTSGVNCGDGMELTDTMLQVLPDHEFCTDAEGHPGSAFYKMQDHKMCIKKQKSKGPGGMLGDWCYVSSACTALGSGRA